MTHVCLKLSLGLAAFASLVGACATSTEPAPLESEAKTGASLPPPSNGSSGGQSEPDSGPTEPPKDAANGYTYGDWSDFGGCSMPCGPGVKTRTRECKRADGIAVNCALCGGACSEQQQCTGVSTCCGPREECCPVMPYNVCGPEMEWCSTTLKKYADECQAKGCIWTGMTACTPGGSVSNPTLPGGMGTCK